MSLEFTLYTDGSCPKPGGPGGWASICIEDRSLDRGHGDFATTNNRMELMGVIGGIRALPPSGVITVYSDSEYVIKGFTLWLPNWRRHPNGWPARIKHQDLWLLLEEQVARMERVVFQHVKGHAGHEWNELADRMAGEQTKLFRRRQKNGSVPQT